MGQRVFGNFVLHSQFFCKPKTAFKAMSVHFCKEPIEGLGKMKMPRVDRHV